LLTKDNRSVRCLKLTCFTTTWPTTTTWPNPNLFFTFSSRRRQRRRQQHHQLSTMWCVSELDFMIISLRATSKWNKYQLWRQLHLIRKCTFDVILLTWLLIPWCCLC
jgi:hypothetical protein